MRIFTRTLLLALLFPTLLSAQTQIVSPGGAGQQSSSGSMIRSGWASPVYSKLKWVPDPRSVTTADVEPERREAGYWSDLAGGSSQQNGVVLLHFIEGTTIFSKGQDNDRAFAILEHTFYNMALVEQMEYVTITAAASPEGTTEDNEKLAANRALAIKEHLLQMFPYLERDRIVTYSAGEDWNGLKRLIEEDLYVPGREAALRLLGAPLSGSILRERLQQIAGGETYRYISEHMFPSLRGGAACLIYFKEPVPASEPGPASVVLPIPISREPVYQVQPGQPQPGYYLPAPQTHAQPQQQHSAPIAVVAGPVAEQTDYEYYNDGEWLKKPLFELKTNLLYDLTATVNLGVSIGLGSKFSLDVPVNYNGWNFSKEKMWRHVLVQPELRYWVDKTFESHFFGFHGLYAYYNIGGMPFSDYMKIRRFEGSLTGMGISYGYRWNFKKPHWGMEATIGVGYAKLKYDEYMCENCGDDTLAAKDLTKQWLGPTKIGLSLIYRVGGKPARTQQ